MPGQTVPNLVTVAVGQGGTVDVYNAVGSTHVVFDIVGFYTTGSGPLGSRFQDLQPFRLFDHAVGNRRRPHAPIGAGGRVRVPVLGQGGVPPTGATAVVMNVTATEPTLRGLSPCPGRRSTTRVEPQLRARADRPEPRDRQRGTGRKINLFNSVGSTHLIADIVGYYTPDVSTGEGRFVPVTLSRLFDARRGRGAVRSHARAIRAWGFTTPTWTSTVRPPQS